ncbi:hypothetical protein JCM2811A_13380 [Methylorubrum rhodinum]
MLGSEAKLGVACGVTQGAIWKAKTAGRVSGEMAVKIERATSGAIPRWRLRPDLWDAPTSSMLNRPGPHGGRPTPSTPEVAA